MTTVAIDTAPATPTTIRRPTVALTVITIIFSFLAFISIVGSFLFSYPLGGLWGTLGGVLLDAGGIGMAFCALRIWRGNPAVYRLALGLMAAEIGWGIYKVFIYHEGDSVLFLALSLVASALLVLPAVRRYATRGQR